MDKAARLKGSQKLQTVRYFICLMQWRFFLIQNYCRVRHFHDMAFFNLKILHHWLCQSWNIAPFLQISPCNNITYEILVKDVRKIKKVSWLKTELKIVSWKFYKNHKKYICIFPIICFVKAFVFNEFESLYCYLGPHSTRSSCQSPHRQSLTLPSKIPTVRLKLF